MGLGRLISRGSHLIGLAWRSVVREPGINILLFLATVATTVGAGALQAGVDPIRQPAQLYRGIPFSAALLAILLVHEFSHYFTSRRHAIAPTLPYFIPAPHFIGTFGAFIRMRGPVGDRRALLEVGASGPLAGVAVAIGAMLVGLPLSEVRPMPPGEGGGLILGDSLLSWLLTRLLLGPLPETAAVIIHPVAFAGWIGLFITCLNLIPIGQLDGGHVMYALLGPRHRLVSRACLGLLVAWGAYGLLSGEGWPGWLLWGVLLMALGVGHPHPLDPLTPLDSRRRAIGWLTVLVFIATFVPVPFKI